ncbi:MAG: dTMP kinase, partial [Spirochaetota bacterium]
MAGTRDILKGFIVFEGLDGSGTTTQAKLLAARLKENGYTVHLTAEPTNGPIGTMIRDALHRRTPLETTTLAYLYAADRYEHLWGSRDSITSMLEKGIVLSDRFVLSSLAYQSTYAPRELVEQLNAPFPYPEHLIYVHVTPETAEERRAGRGTPDIFEHLEFQRTVALRYEEVLAACAGS